MNKEIKEKWVTALRSGEYKQGKSCLGRHKEDGTEEYCCLGVLCCLAVAAGAIPPPAGNTALDRYELVFDQKRGFLPESVKNWAEINDCTGDLVTSIQIMPKNMVSKSIHSSLSSLNDHGNYSFDQIATVIEEQF